MEIVIVLGGPNTKENIKTLLENRYGKAYEDFRFVGVDGGALRLLDEHLTMEVAIGDFDSVTKEQRDLIHGAATTVVQLPSEKDDTDFEAALLWVKEHYEGVPIHVLGSFGGRVDHAISTLWTMMRPDLAPLIPYVVFEDATNVVNFIQPGTYTIEKMDFTKYLSFISMTPVENVTLVDVKNVKDTLDSKNYAYPVALVSNEFTADKMTISFTKGLILVAQTRDHWR